MMTAQQKLVAELTGLMNQPVCCHYNGKERVGTIVCARQGPMRKNDRGWYYLNEPDGDVYIDWLEVGTSDVKCFKWEKVLRWSFIEKLPDVGLTLSVVRPRPLLEAV